MSKTIYVVGGKAHSMSDMKYRRDYIAQHISKLLPSASIKYIYFLNGSLADILKIKETKLDSNLHYISIGDKNFLLANYLSFFLAFYLKNFLLKIKKNDQIIFTLPRAIGLRKYFKSENCLYDCSDNWEGQFPDNDFFSKLKKFLLKRREKAIINHSDTITASSKYLVNKIKKDFPKKNISHLPHGFESAKEPNYKSSNERKNITISLVASMTKADQLKIDYDYIKNIINEGKNIRLNICGPIDQNNQKVCDIIEHSHVEYFGIINQQDIPEFISKSDVGLIPYKMNEFTDGIFPIKTLEYLSVGVPLILSPLKSIQMDKQFSKWLLFLDKEESSFEKKITEYLSNQEIYKSIHEIRLNYLWKNIIEENYIKYLKSSDG